jgi:hypothetical protein
MIEVPATALKYIKSHLLNEVYVHEDSKETESNFFLGWAIGF